MALRSLTSTFVAPSIRHLPRHLPSAVRPTPLPVCNAAAQQQLPSDPVPQSTPIIDQDDLCAFIQSELEACFATGTITTQRYAQDFVFQDPLVQLEGTSQHQLQLTVFRTAFGIAFKVFACTPTDAATFTARWSMTCTLRLAPWRPPLVITGRSIINVDPLTGRLASQRDVWDAVADIQAPSVEAYLYILQQLTSLYTTPDLETPSYTVLCKQREYEVRLYDNYTVAATPMAPGDRISGGSGFNELAAFTIGAQNATNTKLEMTTPVFTTAGRDNTPTMQFVVEGSKASNVPAPLGGQQRITSSVVQSRVVAARTFGGWPQDWEVREEERLLRGALLVDGLTPGAECTLARYNDPFTPPWLRRNEVLIELVDYRP